MRKGARQIDPIISANRKACGYRINVSCANCNFCTRQFVNGITGGACMLHNFPVNLDRGICRDFDNIAKH